MQAFDVEAPAEYSHSMIFEPYIGLHSKGHLRGICILVLTASTVSTFMINCFWGFSSQNLACVNCVGWFRQV